MSYEKQIEVYRQHRTAQEKYVYFLLAATGAAIALAVNQTHDAKLMWSQIPLALAVGLWSLSFFFGCKHLHYVESTLFANGELLKVLTGEHQEVGDNPQFIAATSEGIRKAINSNSKLAVQFAHIQFLCLVFGAIAYLCWHVLEMWLRS